MADEFSSPSSSSLTISHSASASASASSSNPTSTSSTSDPTPPLSSSSGSQSLASTHPIEEHEYQDQIEENTRNGWGQVVPVNPGRGYSAFNLNGEDPITFGRHPDLSYVFDKERVFNDYRHISKKHFVIKKYVNGDVKIIDLSSNGTFVNGTMVGKGRIYPLTHLCTISMGLPELQIFTFINFEDKKREDEQMPVEFKGKYALENVMLGEGAYGKVKKCFLKRDPSKKFAVKILKKGMYSNNKYDIAYEASILATINHQNIVKVEDCFENKDYLYMVLELVNGGELFHYVKNKGPIAEERASKFFLQLLQGVSYLHQKGITHRDLKPENILLDDKEYPSKLKIADFGMSRFVSENSLMETTMVGTRLYLSPEVIDPLNTKGYTKKVDAWALGCILFIILGGYPPFSQEDDCSNVELDILNGRYTFHKERWENISEKAKDLVRGLLTVNVEERLSVAEALEHEFVCGAGAGDDELAAPPVKRVRSS